MTSTETHWVDQLARQSEIIRRAEQAANDARDFFTRAGSRLARLSNEVDAERLILALMQEKAAAELAAVR